MPPQDDASDALSARPASEFPPSPPQHQVVIRQLSDVENDPAKFRAAIATYAPFVEGTHLPEVFRDFHEHCKDVSPPSFLLLIGSCLPAWFERAKPKKSDKSDQKVKQSFSKAEADLNWLLELIRDYVRFTRSQLPPPDVKATIERIDTFCQVATNEKEVFYGIEILYELSKRAEVSLEDLHKVLTILTATAKAVSPIPDLLQAYLHLLLTGNVGETCLHALEQLITVPTRENETDGLLYARGACRLLGIAIEYQNQAKVYIVRLPQFIDLLYDAASQEIFRFSRDILSACESIFASEARRAELLENDLAKIIATLSLCLKLHPQEENNGTLSSRPPQSMLSNPSTASAPVRVNFEGQLAKRLSQAELVGRQLEALWTQLNEEQRMEVSGYVLRYPKFNPESLVFICLRYTFSENLGWLAQSNWRILLDEVEVHFIKDMSVGLNCRTEAIRLLRTGFTALGTISSRSIHTAPVLVADQDYVEAINSFLAALRNQCMKETDQSVLNTFLNALPPILGAMGQADGSDSSIPETIAILERLMSEKATTSETATNITTVLVSTFRELFDSQPKHAIAAFESLVKLAGLECTFPEARLEAMRLLFRIRCTSSGFVYVDNRTDSEYVAAMLCRTVDSAVVNSHERKTQRQSASSSSLSSRSEVSDSKWLYDDKAHRALNSLGPSKIVTTDRSSGQAVQSHLRLDIGAWLAQATTCLQADTDWETYSYVLIHLGSQLTNIRLFRHSLPTVAKLRQVIHEQIVNESFKAPPIATGLFKHDVALCLFNILTPLIAYATLGDVEIDKSHWERQLVQAFMAGMDDSKYDGTFRGCVHALSVCSLEIPERVGREYPRILENMTRVTTKSHLSVHMLEFLSQVAILPEVHKHFNQEDKRKIFNLCIAVLNDKRDAQLKQQESHEQGTNLILPPGTRTQTPSRHSGIRPFRSPYRSQMMQDVGVPLYASALAYHTMICWFLSLPIRDREDLAKELLTKLVWHNKQNDPMIDQQAEVFRDMMLRTTYSDLGETGPDPSFSPGPAVGSDIDADARDALSVEATDGKIESMSWLVGYSIVTLETAGTTGRTQVTKRQASGTTYATYQQSTRPVPPHQAPSNTAIQDDKLPIEMLPQHVMLQLQATAAPMAPEEQPIPLPRDETVSRALRIFDLNATIDSHKAGVLFVGPNQTQQAEIMSNVTGSPDYEAFLSGLGYQVSLRPPCGLINPQGLRYPSDGEKSIAWCDRVTEIVFLVPTMMPLDMEEEYEWLRRWANVGNSYVNIIFNQSGRAWKLENLQSQFNYVNIVITHVDWNDGPVGTSTDSGEVFYQVQVLTKESFPNISPAADPKVVSASQLPRFVRVLAISACVFSQAWEKKDEDREFHSPWRDRLIAIKELRKKYATGQQDSHHRVGLLPSQAVNTSATSGRKTPVPREDHTTGQETNALLSRLDFTRWMGFKPSADRSK